jgi:asparagine synthetase B (glutamine-hydrolysing)
MRLCVVVCSGFHIVEKLGYLSHYDHSKRIMPGIVGICGNELRTSIEGVARAAQGTVYGENVRSELLYSDRNLILGKSAFDFLETSGMFDQSEDVYVWIDGEIFNGRELASQPDPSLAMTFSRHYRDNTLDKILGKIDGVYVALIYDLRRKEFHLITDRYGLKVFYLCHTEGSLIVAPELKCFPFFEEFRLTIRKEMIDCFLHLEHMMGSATWFEGVDVTEPSMVYTFSWSKNKLSKRRYWSWSSITRSSLSLDDAANLNET